MEIAEQNISLPLEGEVVFDGSFDPLEVAAAALAKLKEAGLPGVVESYRTEETPEAEEAEVIYLKPLKPFEPREVKIHDHKKGFTKSKESESWRYEEYKVVAAARQDPGAFDRLLNSNMLFLRRTCSNYFLAGGTNDDLMQEAMFGFYKAVRDYDGNGAAFRSFLELCVVRQLITAITTATRFKHQPLNQYVSFSAPPEADDSGMTLGDALPDSSVREPDSIAISTEELQALVFSLGASLSKLESDALRLYLEDNNYEDMGEELGVSEKTIDNALQRVKRKIHMHQKSREVLL